MHYLPSSPLDYTPVFTQNEHIFTVVDMTSHQIHLRDLNRGDLDDFYVWASDPEVAQYMTWDAYTSKEEALRFLVNVAEPHPYFKAICYGDRVIGSITLTQGTGNHRCRAELGYVLAKKYWGNGLATAAVIQVLSSGFQDLNISRIEALIDPDNLASRRVLEKAGMKQDGLLKNYVLFKGAVKDRYIYSMYATPYLNTATGNFEGLVPLE